MSAAELPAWKSELDAVVGARHGGSEATLLPLLERLAARYPEAAEVRYELASTCDHLGKEREAIGHYEAALERGGLAPNLRSKALLGLGSSLRCIGEAAKAEAVLAAAKQEFPEFREFDVFRAMALHNLGRHAEAMELLLLTLVETADDLGINAYQRAIRYYADKLDRPVAE
jgi:tetratricopeptide (TPR) repeat protein